MEIHINNNSHKNIKHNTHRISEERSIFEKRTSWVVLLTFFTMIVEIGFGYWTNSMALLADGWHMSSHVFALGLTWIAYVFARKYSKTETSSFDKEKLLSLAGFTSAIVLMIIALLMAFESIVRFINPIVIKFDQAIYVAIIGLIVNGLSAIFLHGGHEHHDHNIRSAYLHVLADGLTSITAIIALIAGKFFNIFTLDSISGVISSLVITKWAIELIKISGKDLINYYKFVDENHR